MKIEKKPEHLIIKFLGIKIKIRTNRKSKKEVKLLNTLFENNSNSVLLPKIKNRKETLEILLNSNKSMSRYGDGEFNLIFGHDLAFQDYSEDLAARLSEILKNNDENILVGIPDKFGNLDAVTDACANFWREYFVYNREKVYQILDMNKKYIDTDVTRLYLGNKNKSECKELFDGFKKLFSDKDIIIVEGKYSRLGYKNDLFSGAKSIKRILGPAKSAWTKYNELLNECRQQSKDVLFLIALGPTATVLAYDLAKFGYRALDVGHIDIEYEWYLQGATKKVAIKNKYVNESKTGKISTELNDKTYTDEILKDLSA
ncbi:MAG: SP_1767 family glycosyltransferase [Muribaculaceae bacterium]|nr:SP_1767 family glycosyltransferase [Muribaculaceae bacterium]